MHVFLRPLQFSIEASDLLDHGLSDVIILVESFFSHYVRWIEQLHLLSRYLVFGNLFNPYYLADKTAHGDLVVSNITRSVR